MNALLRAIRGADVSVYYFLSRFVGNPFLDRLARFEETNYLLKGGIFVALYWYFWFRVGADRAKRRGVILTTLIGTIFALFVGRGIAFLVPFRVRPMYNPALAHPAFSIPMQYDLVHWSAFPSDTAAYFFALAFGIMYLSRCLAIPIALYTAVWICLSRMYLGIHYASDTIAGAAIGIAMAWASIKSEWLRSMIARPVLAADTAPHWFYGFAFLFSCEMATIFEGLRSLGNATLHVVMAGPHLRFASSHSNRPINAWGGFLALAAFLGAVAYAVWIVRRKHHHAPAALRGAGGDVRAASPGFKRKPHREDRPAPRL